MYYPTVHYWNLLPCYQESVPFCPHPLALNKVCRSPISIIFYSYENMSDNKVPLNKKIYYGPSFSDIFWSGSYWESYDVFVETRSPCTLFVPLTRDVRVNYISVSVQLHFGTWCQPGLSDPMVPQLPEWKAKPIRGRQKRTQHYTTEKVSWWGPYARPKNYHHYRKAFCWVLDFAQETYFFS